MEIRETLARLATMGRNLLVSATRLASSFWVSFAMKGVILAFLLSLPVHSEDEKDFRKLVQLEEIAEAIDEASDKSDRVAALLIATGYIETGYSLRIHDGRCETWECDHGRARGPWQVWRNWLPASEWRKMKGLEYTREQAKVAAYRIRIGLEQCDNSVRGAIARYVGLGCDVRNSRLEERFRLYKKALRALKKEEFQ